MFIAQTGAVGSVGYRNVSFFCPIQSVAAQGRQMCNLPHPSYFHEKKCLKSKFSICILSALCTEGAAKQTFFPLFYYRQATGSPFCVILPYS